MTYSLNRLRILVVDDSPNMRQILRRILRIFGLRDVHEAGDGAEALAVMSRACPDLVLTNWEMAPMNGLDFVRTLRSRDKSPSLFIPIIMISGHTEISRVVEARNAGVNEFVAKPVSAKGLYARILRVIDNPRTYVESSDYFGPDRRIRAEPFKGRDRRKAPPGATAGEAVVDWV